MNIIQAMVEAQESDNYILYSLLIFLHIVESEPGAIDVDAPIGHFEEDAFVLTVSFFELHQGIDVPDAMILEKTKTLRQLAEEIRQLEKISDETFRKKVMMDKASWRAVLDRN